MVSCQRRARCIAGVAISKMPHVRNLKETMDSCYRQARCIAGGTLSKMPHVRNLKETKAFLPQSSQMYSRELQCPRCLMSETLRKPRLSCYRQARCIAGGTMSKMPHVRNLKKTMVSCQRTARSIAGVAISKRLHLVLVNWLLHF